MLEKIIGSAVTLVLVSRIEYGVLVAALELYGIGTMGASGATPKIRRLIAGTSLASSIDLAVPPTGAGNAFGSGMVVRPACRPVRARIIVLYYMWDIR